MEQQFLSFLLWFGHCELPATESLSGGRSFHVVETFLQVGGRFVSSLRLEALGISIGVDVVLVI